MSGHHSIIGGDIPDISDEHPTPRSAEKAWATFQAMKASMDIVVLLALAAIGIAHARGSRRI